MAHRPAVAAWVLAAALASLAAVTVLPAEAGPAPEPRPAAIEEGEVELGRQLFQTGCASCHGAEGRGTSRGPNLHGVGAASVDFWVSTGRMPLERNTRIAVRKPPSYDRRQVDALIAFVTSLDGGGPDIPEIDLASADIVEGGELYRSNCAACHGAVGIGGALAQARHAPRLSPATPLQVAEAVRIGPGAMPSFGPDTFDDEQLSAIVKYVRELDSPEDPGGLGLGHTGPIPEGFVGWLVGLGALLAAAWWIGERE